MVLSFYLFNRFDHCVDQSWECGLHDRAEPLSPIELGRLDAKDDHLWQSLTQCIGQCYDLAQSSVVEGKAIRRQGQPDLIRRKPDNLARLSPNISGVHDHSSFPSLQHSQQIQPSHPHIKGCHSLWQSPLYQFLHQSWADSIVAAQGITNAKHHNPTLDGHNSQPRKSRITHHAIRSTSQS
jgi:hypothetical protein